MNGVQQNILTDEEVSLAYRDAMRDSIMDFEESLSQVEGVTFGDSEICPLKHSFSDGIYVREITIPQGMFIVGKIHKHDHPNFLLKGEVMVVTEEGVEHLSAPCSMISKAGTKRALYSKTDLVWTTIHYNPTNTQDLDELEKIVIAPSFKKYDEFALSKGSTINKIKKSFIKLLS